jgi:hypothetical protein
MHIDPPMTCLQSYMTVLVHTTLPVKAVVAVSPTLSSHVGDSMSRIGSIDVMRTIFDVVIIS